MLDINGKNIDITRGNILSLEIDAKNTTDSTSYEFQVGDIIRFKVMEDGNVKNIFLEKDFTNKTTQYNIHRNYAFIREWFSLKSDDVKKISFPHYYEENGLLIKELKTGEKWEIRLDYNYNEVLLKRIR